MSAALGLYRLQQVDSQMDQVRARLETIRETLENDRELRAAMDALSAAETNFKNAERLLKDSESEVEKQRIKIEQTESSLYSGTVHNPKELQDLQKDVVSLKKHLATLEERQLEAMINAEVAEKEMVTAKQKLESVKSNLNNQNRDLTQEAETLNKNLERLESERNAATSNLADEMLGTYDQLRKQKRGIAVTAVSENSCSACGTTLTQSQLQSARSTAQLYSCPTCGRILYAN